MSHVTCRTRPQDEENLKKLCKQLQISRSEAVRVAIETAVSFLDRKPARKFSRFAGSFEGSEDLSTNCSEKLKKKLHARHKSQR